MYAFLYLSCTTVMCISLLTTGRHRKAVYFVIATMFGMLAFSMTTRAEMFVDTVRFNETIDYFRNVRLTGGWNDAWQSLLRDYDYQSIPVAGSLVAVASLFPTDRFFLFIVGFLIAIIALNYLERIFSTHAPSEYLVVFSVLLFFCWFNFQAAVQGVRNMVAYLLLASESFVLLEPEYSIRRKAVSTVLIFSTVFVHSSVIIILPIVLVALAIKSKAVLRTFDLLLLIYYPFQPIVLSVFFRIPFIANNSSLSFKTTQYTSGNLDSMLGSNVSLYRDVLKDILLVIVIVILGFMCKIVGKKITDYVDPKIIELFIAVTCIVFGSINNQVIFDRLSSFMFFMAFPLLIPLIQTIHGCLKHGSKQYTVLFYGVVVLLTFFSVVFLIDNLRAGVRFYSIFGL